MLDKTFHNKEKSQFYIQRIYNKDISFEVPHAPHIFQKKWKPKVNINFINNSSKLHEDTYEVVLSVTVSVILEKEIAFLCEVQQAGIFILNENNINKIDYFLGVCCPEILFPYARECVTNLAIRGDFPKLNLSPVNFNELFINYRKQQLKNQ